MYIDCNVADSGGGTSNMVADDKSWVGYASISLTATIV